MHLSEFLTNFIDNLINTVTAWRSMPDKTQQDATTLSNDGRKEKDPDGRDGESGA